MSDIPSVDEILAGYGSYCDRETEYDAKEYSFDDAKAALTRREERIKLEAQLNARKAVSYFYDDDVLYGSEILRVIIKDNNEQIRQLEQQLKTLDGQENTNGE